MSHAVAAFVKSESKALEEARDKALREIAYLKNALARAEESLADDRFASSISNGAVKALASDVDVALAVYAERKRALDKLATFMDGEETA